LTEAIQEDSDALWKKWLGYERALSYRSASQSLTIAELATWNQSLSASLMSDVAHTEIALRNLVHDVLSQRLRATGHSAHWLDDPTGELSRCGGLVAIHRIRDATQRAGRLKKNPASSDVIAELSLGFWTTFFTKSFRPFHPDLVSALVGKRSRSFSEIPTIVSAFHRLRNRLAHHHRMIHRDLTADWETVLELAGLIHPHLSDYIVRKSKTPELIARFSQITEAKP